MVGLLPHTAREVAKTDRVGCSAQASGVRALEALSFSRSLTSFSFDCLLLVLDRLPMLANITSLNGPDFFSEYFIGSTVPRRGASTRKPA